METAMAAISEVMTVEEARLRLRIGRNAMYEAIARAEIPSIRVGRKILVPRAAFDRMISGDGARPAVKAAS